MKEFPVGDWSPEPPSIPEGSNAIGSFIAESISEAQSDTVLSGMVYWDEDRSAYVCKGLESGLWPIEDWVIPLGTEQVWVHANFSVPTGTTRTNIFEQDGSLYYSASGCTHSETKDCRLLAQLIWNSQNELTTIINNISNNVPNEYLAYGLSGYAKTSGLIRQFTSG
jgi:hypothetical protein